MSLGRDTVEKIMIYSLGLAAAISRPSVAIGNILNVVSVLCALYLGYKAYKDGSFEDKISNYKKYYQMWLLMVMSFVPSLVFSINFNVSLKYIFDLWLWRMVPFFLVTLFASDKKRIYQALAMVLISLSLDSLYTIYQLSYTHRPWGFGANALNLGTVLVMVIPMVAVVLLDENFSGNWKKFCFVVFLCLIGGVIANNSRNAWLSLTIVLPFIALKYVLGNKKLLIGCIVVSIGLGVFFGSNKFFMNRAKSITDFNYRGTTVRFGLWNNAILMIKDNPIVGVGFGNYEEVISRDDKYRTYKLTRGRIESNPHNYFLQILADSGVLGLFGYLAFMLFIVFDNLRCWIKQKNPYALMIAATCFGAFFITAHFTTVMHKSAEIKTWWFLLGSLLYLRNEFNLAQNKDISNNED